MVKKITVSKNVEEIDMKKAGIITHYNVHNHGANLQLYALSRTLKRLGYESKALQFQKNYDFLGGSTASNKYNISLKSIPYYMKYILKNGIKRTIYNYKKKVILGKFRKKEKLVGEYYSRAKDLDLVVIGSDEIFSIEAGPNPWYYGIGCPCQNQISYAASFGPTTLDAIKKYNVENLVEAGLKNIRRISVRDKNSYEIVDYYTNATPQIVCDPVLLYGFYNEQSEEKIRGFKKKHPERFCIVYSYDYNMNDNKTQKEIRRYAIKHKLKIYSIGYFHDWCDMNIEVKPLDIFAWFKCADMVFTDTFHGTVISLTTGTQFVTKINGNSNKLKFLLEQFEVANREVTSFTDVERIKPIDYNKEKLVIKKIRVHSINVLKEMMGL